MDNKVQEHWMQAISKQKEAQVRISLTFRYTVIVKN